MIRSASKLSCFSFVVWILNDARLNLLWIVADRCRQHYRGPN